MPDCKQCQSPFEVAPEDLAFYDKVSPVINGVRHPIPSPTLCPDCRLQRRLAFRNERSLFHRKCDLTGRQMISAFPPDTKFPVYEIAEWQSDKWDAKNYGRDFDFSRPFFEQFKDLCDEVPHYNRFVSPTLDINSDYTNCASGSKNCYLIFAAGENEDCYYSRYIGYSKNCVDCLQVNESELCYECINVSHGYRCFFCQECDSSSECYFSSELRGCNHCFGCYGLVQKEYHIFNEPVSKEEWQEKVGKLVLTPDVIRLMRARSLEKSSKIPHRFAHILKSANVTGDHILESHDSHNVFDSKNIEHCNYCYGLSWGAKDCMDFSLWGRDAELLYECHSCGHSSYHDLFCNNSWMNVAESMYLDTCQNGVSNCFGCFGLKKSKHCILNKQYAKEEYEVLVPKIIEHMKRTGEWGEFFPISLSPYSYSETLAQELFPVTRSQALERSWPWHPDESEHENYKGQKIDVPAAIKDVSDEICKQILTCEASGMHYKIIPQELKFYREMGLPIPLRAFDQRHKDRQALLNPYKLWDRNCAKCGTPIQTTYSPDRPEIVYCEKCYLETVY